MTIVVSGSQTYNQRELIKSLGGSWDAEARQWTLPDRTSERDLQRLRSVPGIAVAHVDTPPAPKWATPDEIEDALDALEIHLDFAADQDEPETVGKTSVYGNDQTWLNEFRHKNPTQFIGFDSLKAFADFISKTPETIRSDRDHKRNSGWVGRAEFCGTPDMSGALARARNGWSAGQEMAEKVGEMLKGEHALNKHRTYGVAGGRVNVGRLLSGSPNHMVRRALQPKTKVVTLFVDVVNASGIQAENMLIRAAVVAAIADRMENNGYSCEIVAVGSAAKNGVRWQFATTIKQAGETLNLSDAAFGLGHPSMLRRLMVGAVAHEIRMRPLWRGMGSPERCFRPADLPPGSFYLDMLTSNPSGNFIEKVEQVIEWIVPDGFPVELIE